MTGKPIIALDADGVLLDYHHAYRHLFKKAFDHLPELADPQAYHPMDRWKVPRLDPAQRTHLRNCQDEDFWSTLPAIDGALAAANALHDAGFELVCVSALPSTFEAARLANLQALGYPIDRVFATPETPQSDPNKSVKAAALDQLRPVAFVDDYAPYLRGIPPGIHAALVLREPNGSPNQGDALSLANSTHNDLAGFAKWWLER